MRKRTLHAFLDIFRDLIKDSKIRVDGVVQDDTTLYVAKKLYEQIEELDPDKEWLDALYASSDILYSLKLAFKKPCDDESGNYEVYLYIYDYDYTDYDLGGIWDDFEFDWRRGRESTKHIRGCV